ncbi:MAG: nucleotide exchange factor GrpE [Xanthomonadales bacterium]|nr:nucleotide exchange factor GrpE [Xanthomonadales bacterium]
MNKQTKQPESELESAGSEQGEVTEASKQDDNPVENGDEAETVDSEFLDLQFALGEAERKMADYKEAMLRMQAEMENLRKRLIKDLERSRKRALESVMLDLLPVKDSLERGTETDQETATVESLIEGKSLIIRMLEKVMQDHGLEEIDPAGSGFDPELHQAMTMIDSAEHEPNTVIEVMQKGYRLNDRLIRPAMVVVSKVPDND